MTATDEPVAELLFEPSDDVPQSTDEATIIPWAAASQELAASTKVWLATGRASGRPHVQPVLTVWQGGTLFVSTRPGSVKGRNLARNGHCVVTLSTDTIDLVVEGLARQVATTERVQAIAAAFEAKYQWGFTVRDGKAFDRDLPGSPEYTFYEIAPTTAYGYGPDGLTATRWRF